MAYLVDRSCIGRFQDVVFALQNERRRIAEMPVEMAVGAGFPLAEKVHATRFGPRAENGEPVVDRVVGLGAAREMHPCEIVSVETGNRAGAQWVVVGHDTSF